MTDRVLVDPSSTSRVTERSDTTEMKLTEGSEVSFPKSNITTMNIKVEATETSTQNKSCDGNVDELTSELSSKLIIEKKVNNDIEEELSNLTLEDKENGVVHSNSGKNVTGGRFERGLEEEDDGLVRSSSGKLLARGPTGVYGLATSRNTGYQQIQQVHQFQGTYGKRHRETEFNQQSTKYAYSSSDPVENIDISQLMPQDVYISNQYQNDLNEPKQVNLDVQVHVAPSTNLSGGGMYYTNPQSAYPYANGNTLNIPANIGDDGEALSLDSFDELLASLNDAVPPPREPIDKMSNATSKALVRKCLLEKKQRQHLNSSGQSPSYSSDCSQPSPLSDLDASSPPPSNYRMTAPTQNKGIPYQSPPYQQPSMYGPVPSPNGSISSGVPSPAMVNQASPSPQQRPQSTSSSHYTNEMSPQYVKSAAGPYPGTTSVPVYSQPPSVSSNASVGSPLSQQASSPDSGYDPAHDEYVLSPEQGHVLDEALTVLGHVIGPLSPEEAERGTLPPTLPATSVASALVVPSEVKCQKPSVSAALQTSSIMPLSTTSTIQLPIPVTQSLGQNTIAATSQPSVLILQPVMVMSTPQVSPGGKGNANKVKKQDRKKPVPILPKGINDHTQNRPGTTATPPSDPFKMPTGIPPPRGSLPINVNRPISQTGMTPPPSPTTPQPLIIARRHIADLKSDDMIRQDQDGDTYLGIAICQGDPHMVRALLERYKRDGTLANIINKPNHSFQTPVYLATVTWQPAVVRMLIQNGADVNIQAKVTNNHDGADFKAPIHCAARYGARGVETMKALLEAAVKVNIVGQDPIDINTKNSDGLTALMVAARSHGKPDSIPETRRKINSIQIIRELLANGADLNAQDSRNGKTALHYAVESRDLELVREILDSNQANNHVLLQVKMYNGNTCLHLAAGLNTDNVEEHKKLLILLMRQGADPSVKNNEKLKPKDLVANHNIEIMNVLGGKNQPTKNVPAPQNHHPNMLQQQPMMNIPPNLQPNMVFNQPVMSVMPGHCMYPGMQQPGQTTCVTQVQRQMAPPVSHPSMPPYGMPTQSCLYNQQPNMTSCNNYPQLSRAGNPMMQQLPRMPPRTIYQPQ